MEDRDKDDPGRFIKEPCEWCGLAPTIRWYDPCCRQQEQKYFRERKEWIAKHEKQHKQK